MSEGKEKKNIQDKNETTSAEPPGFHRVRSPNFVNCYTNNVEISSSPWDMRFMFGEIMGMKDGQISVEEHAQIVMSLQHAKVFAAILVQQIEQIEQRFGEIQLLVEKAADSSDQQQDRTTGRVPSPSVEEKKRQRA